MAVEVYRDRDYRGDMVSLDVGEYNEHVLIEKNMVSAVSSIRVPAGWMAELFDYSNYQQHCYVVAGDEPFIGDLFNDRIRSIRVRNSITGPIIYADRDYKGQRLLLPDRSYWLNLGSGWYGGMSGGGSDNDSISSLRVPRGFMVRLYEQGGWTGPSVDYTQDTPFVGDALNDHASSLEVRR